MGRHREGRGGRARPSGRHRDLERPGHLRRHGARLALGRRDRLVAGRRARGLVHGRGRHRALRGAAPGRQRPRLPLARRADHARRARHRHAQGHGSRARRDLLLAGRRHGRERRDRFVGRLGQRPDAVRRRLPQRAQRHFLLARPAHRDLCRRHQGARRGRQLGAALGARPPLRPLARRRPQLPRQHHQQRRARASHGERRVLDREALRLGRGDRLQLGGLQLQRPPDVDDLAHAGLERQRSRRPRPLLDLRRADLRLEGRRRSLERPCDVGAGRDEDRSRAPTSRSLRASRAR